MKFAIVSDIHGTPSSASSDSYTTTTPPPAPPNQHPLEDLIRQATLNPDLAADALICCGDMTNRASPEGTLYVWGRLGILAEALGAAVVVASPGNHDLQSRADGGDSRSVLINLIPSYPTRDKDRDSVFWSDGYTTVESDDYRIVTLNTCLHHTTPDPSMTDEERKRHNARLERGELEDSTIDSLVTSVKALAPKPINILVCHHHLIEHEQLDAFSDDYGKVLRGNRLLWELDSCSAGRWIVVHGHKHIPRLLYSFGSSNAPVVFGAASLGAKLGEKVNTVVRNQFHLMDCSPTVSSGSTLNALGTVRSWCWGFGQGWKPAQLESTGLPPVAGFGYQVAGLDLAAALENELGSSSTAIAGWEQIKTAHPDIEYLLPQDLGRLELQLEARGIRVQRHSQGNFSIGRAP